MSTDPGTDPPHSSSPSHLNQPNDNKDDHEQKASSSSSKQSILAAALARWSKKNEEQLLDIRAGYFRTRRAYRIGFYTLLEHAQIRKKIWRLKIIASSHGRHRRLACGYACLAAHVNRARAERTRMDHSIAFYNQHQKTKAIFALKKYAQDMRASRKATLIAMMTVFRQRMVDSVRLWKTRTDALKSGPLSKDAMMQLKQQCQKITRKMAIRGALRQWRSHIQTNQAQQTALANFHRNLRLKKCQYALNVWRHEFIPKMEQLVVKEAGYITQKVRKIVSLIFGVWHRLAKERRSRTQTQNIMAEDHSRKVKLRKVKAAFKVWRGEISEALRERKLDERGTVWHRYALLKKGWLKLKTLISQGVEVNDKGSGVMGRWVTKRRMPQAYRLEEASKRRLGYVSPPSSKSVSITHTYDSPEEPRKDIPKTTPVTPRNNQTQPDLSSSSSALPLSSSSLSSTSSIVTPFGPNSRSFETSIDFLQQGTRVPLPTSTLTIKKPQSYPTSTTLYPQNHSAITQSTLTHSLHPQNHATSSKIVMCPSTKSTTETLSSTPGKVKPKLGDKTDLLDSDDDDEVDEVNRYGVDNNKVQYNVIGREAVTRNTQSKEIHRAQSSLREAYPFTWPVLRLRLSAIIKRWNQVTSTRSRLRSIYTQVSTKTQSSSSTLLQSPLSLTRVSFQQWLSMTRSRLRLRTIGSTILKQYCNRLVSDALSLWHSSTLNSAMIDTTAIHRAYTSFQRIQVANTSTTATTSSVPTSHIASTSTTPTSSTVTTPRSMQQDHRESSHPPSPSAPPPTSIHHIGGTCASLVAKHYADNCPDHPLLAVHADHTPGLLHCHLHHVNRHIRTLHLTRLWDAWRRATILTRRRRRVAAIIEFKLTRSLLRETWSLWRTAYFSNQRYQRLSLIAETKRPSFLQAQIFRLWRDVIRSSTERRLAFTNKYGTAIRQVLQRIKMRYLNAWRSAYTLAQLSRVLEARADKWRRQKCLILSVNLLKQGLNQWKRETDLVKTATDYLQSVKIKHWFRRWHSLSLLKVKEKEMDRKGEQHWRQTKLRQGISSWLASTHSLRYQSNLLRTASQLRTQRLAAVAVAAIAQTAIDNQNRSLESLSSTSLSTSSLPSESHPNKTASNVSYIGGTQPMSLHAVQSFLTATSDLFNNAMLTSLSPSTSSASSTSSLPPHVKNTVALSALHVASRSSSNHLSSSSTLSSSTSLEEGPVHPSSSMTTTSTTNMEFAKLQSASTFPRTARSRALVEEADALLGRHRLQTSQHYQHSSDHANYIINSSSVLSSSSSTTSTTTTTLSSPPTSLYSPLRKVRQPPRSSILALVNLPSRINVTEGETISSSTSSAINNTPLRPRPQFPLPPTTPPTGTPIPPPQMPIQSSSTSSLPLKTPTSVYNPMPVDNQSNSSTSLQSPPQPKVQPHSQKPHPYINTINSDVENKAVGTVLTKQRPAPRPLPFD